MTNIENISWPKDFPDLKKLDNLLRCGICYDYMKNPMMTSCSHNYCSLCIRKYMQYKSACPTCFEETFEVTLRINRPLDEIITVFTGARDKIIRHLKLAAVYATKSNDSESNPDLASFLQCSTKKSDNSSVTNLKNDSESLGKSNKVARKLDNGIIYDECNNGISVLSSPNNSKIIRTPTRSGSTTPVTKIPSMFCSPKKSVSSGSPATNGAVVSTVSCPVCCVDIPERNINLHLDKCLSRVNLTTPSNPKVSKRDPIPKRVYSLMAEKDLRKWLKTYGLSTIGDKKALITRLQRYTVLYNSECDSFNPRQVSEIIRQVEKEEKDEKSTLNNLGVVRKPFNRNADPVVIETENKKYIEKNKSHFESLINAMRERDQKYIRPTRLANRINSDSEDEDCYKDTVTLCDQPSTSQNHQLNEASWQHYDPLLNGHQDDSNDVIKVCDESPDLSKGACYSNIKPDKCKLSSYVEAEISINEYVKSSPESGKSYSNTESRTILSNAELEILKCDNASNKLAVKENDSDDSNESISLLAEYENSVEDEKTSSKGQIKTNSIPQSQIDDPDFIVTESELISTNVSEESEDIFMPTRRSKRQRPEKVEYNLPNRVLRKKRN